MRIFVKVIPKAHKNSVEIVDGVYVVHTTIVPENGKANVQVQKLLAKYFGVGKSCVVIIKGQTTRNKIIDIVQ